MIYFINIELVYIDSYDIKERVYYLTIDKCIYKVVIHEKENNILAEILRLKFGLIAKVCTYKRNDKNYY